LIRNTDQQIKQLETSYASAQADVTKAAADYRAAQVNYQAGNVTKTMVEQAEMGLISAENALQELVHNHDMLIFMFENPTLLSDQSAAK
ncbi:MAG: TolC family protein, partial [Anaerotignum sp.]|nr:TolC family protein [Anaerotignum sp.]